jgi:hypothetical protein
MTANLAESDDMALAVVQLESLAAVLAGRGFDTRVSRNGGTLSLSVINQGAPGCRENIAASHGSDGRWWFWWSWGDRLACIGDIEAAAFKIAYVLTPQAGG